MMVLRVVGWLAFAAGLALFAFWAEFDMRKGLPSHVSVFTMLGGMLLTAGASVYGAVTHQLDQKRRIQKLEEERRRPPP